MVMTKMSIVFPTRAGWTLTLDNPSSLERAESLRPRQTAASQPGSSAAFVCNLVEVGGQHKFDRHERGETLWRRKKATSS